MPREDDVHWDGSLQGGLLEVGLSPDEVLHRIKREVPLPFWNGGPFFTTHPYEAVTKGATFWIHQRASRGSHPKLEASVEATPTGSLIRYEVRVHRWYFLLALLPVVLIVLGVGGYFLSTVVQPGERAEGELGQSLLHGSCAGFVFMLFFGSFALLAVVFQRQIVRNTLRFFREMFEDVEILDAERVGR